MNTRTMLAGLGLAAVLAGLAGCVSKPENQLGMMSADDLASNRFDVAGERAPSVASMYSMARLSIAQGRDQDAENALHAILVQEPDFLPAYEELARIYVRRGLVDSAAAVLQLGLSVAPRDPVLLNDVGMCHMLLKDYPAALQSFTLAAGQSPTDARYRANMAVALGLMGRPDEALSLFLQIVPPADAHWNVAVLCEASNDAQRAEREYVAAGHPPRLRE